MWIGGMRDIMRQGGRLWSGMPLLKRKYHITPYSVWFEFSTGASIVFHRFSTGSLILNHSDYLPSINSIM